MASPGGQSGRVLIASNRGPVSFAVGDDGSLVARRGAGGLVSGLSSVKDHADVLWVCAALSDADRAAARSAPGGRLDAALTLGKSAVRMLDIPAATFQRAYNSVANSTLWFVHHMLFDTPNQPGFGLAFRREWESFRAYNAAFAEALAEGAGTDVPGRQAEPGQARGGQVRAMVQDYHLPLVPRMLAEHRPDVKIAHFSHTPWAPPDYYRLLPDEVGREVLDGILGADHAGFLCQRWADAFLSCCAEFLGASVDQAAGTVRYKGKVTSVAVHPLGVDAGELRQRAAAPDVEGQVAALTAITAGQRLIVRVDRTELSKNIVRGLAAYRELLITHPEWRGQVTHLAFAYPSRHDLPEYREYTARVQRMAGRNRGRVRHGHLEPADPAGERRLRPLARRLPPRRCAAGQPDPRRDEPGGQGRGDPVRACLCAGPVDGSRCGRRTGRGRAPGQPVRRHADRGGAAPRADHAGRRAGPAVPPGSRRRARAFPPSAWLQAQLDALAE